MANYYFDVDGVLANFHEVKDGWRYATTYKFIRNLKPFMNNINFVKELIAQGENVYISSLVASVPAEMARIEWLAEYLPELKKENIILLQGTTKKYEHIKTDDGILIDDKEVNCRQWTKAGYKAVWLEEKGGNIDLTKIYEVKTKKKA